MASAAGGLQEAPNTNLSRSDTKHGNNCAECRVRFAQRDVTETTASVPNSISLSTTSPRFRVTGFLDRGRSN